MYSLLKQDAEAQPALLKAVELAPDDPIDNWNLARNYDLTGKVEMANQQYKKPLALDSDPERLKGDRCLYSDFLLKKMHDAKAACEFEKSCDPTQHSACDASSKPEANEMIKNN